MLFDKKILVESINTYIQATLTGNEKLIKFSLEELERELAKLPDELNIGDGP